MLTRMRRRLLTATSVLSLILCAATAALWVRSHLREDVVWLNHESDKIVPFDSPVRTAGEDVAHVDQSFMFWSVNGQWEFIWDWRRAEAAAADPPHRPGWSVGKASSERDASVHLWVGDSKQHVWERLGLAFWFDFTANRSDVTVFFPPWAWLMVWSVLPLLWIRIVTRTRRRLRQGICDHCGYDLRAAIERCPECGRVPRHGADRAAGAKILD